MAETAYCTINSSVDGPINGESSFRDRNDQIEVLKFNFAAHNPSDPADPARSSGMRWYEPVEIETKMDKSMPLLLKQLAENAVMDTIKVDFYRQPESGGGEQVLFMTQTFTDCRMYHVDPIIRLPHRGTDSQQRFNFKFFFAQHTVEYPVDGQEMTDDYRQML